MFDCAIVSFHGQHTVHCMDQSNTVDVGFSLDVNTLFTLAARTLAQTLAVNKTVYDYRIFPHRRMHHDVGHDIPSALR